jgi:DNA topoisomerase-1
MALDGAPSTHPAPNVEAADAAGLAYISDEDPGIRRKRSASGFDYAGPDDEPIEDPQTLERIRKLAIPPAYEDVWISPDPNSHLQATGRDARGRKQYRYHANWRSVRDESKFARMAAFGRALPAIRARVEEDLRRHGLPKAKVVAIVVRLLELTLIRVGNVEYARTNKSFGLTTLRDRHARFHGAEVQFEFKGKSGVRHCTGVRDRRLARLVKACQDIPGQRLFQYLDETGARHPIGSADVNAYLHEIVGEAFTAKDFRTWAGTLAAAKALAMQAPPASERESKAAVTLCVKATAGLLGNTPAVCRAAYIHPEVLTAYAEKRLPKTFAEAEGPEFEAAVLEFLDSLAADVERRTGMTPQEQVEASEA